MASLRSPAVEKIAQDMGVRSNLLASVDERRKSWLTEALEGMLSASFASESGFADHLIKTVLALGTHGECEGWLNGLKRGNKVRAKMRGISTALQPHGRALMSHRRRTVHAEARPPQPSVCSSRG